MQKSVSASETTYVGLTASNATEVVVEDSAVESVAEKENVNDDIVAEDVNCSDAKNDEATSDEKPENGECENEKKKKETSEDDEDVDNETSSEDDVKPDTESASLTYMDIAKRLSEAVRNCLHCDAWIEFHFPIEKEIWVKSYNGDELDYVMFTYEVVGDEVVLSAPENVKLTVSVSEINNKIAEMENSLVNANAIIKEKESEIAELMPYKEKFEEAERERVEAEIAQKKQELRNYAVKSGFITEAEVSESGEFAEMINTNNESGIKSVIADRFMASIKDGSNVEHEMSAVKKQSNDGVEANLSNVTYAKRDAKDFLRMYLGK